MTHQTECLCYCIDHLNQRSLSHTFDRHTFDHYYRKHKEGGNAYLIGLNAADMMIANSNEKSNKQEVTHD